MDMLVKWSKKESSNSWGKDIGIFFFLKQIDFKFSLLQICNAASILIFKI